MPDAVITGLASDSPPTATDISGDDMPDTAFGAVHYHLGWVCIALIRGASIPGCPYTPRRSFWNWVTIIGVEVWVIAIDRIGSIAVVPEPLHPPDAKT